MVKYLQIGIFLQKTLFYLRLYLLQFLWLLHKSTKRMMETKNLISKIFQED